MFDHIWDYQRNNIISTFLCVIPLQKLGKCHIKLMVNSKKNDIE